MADKTKETYIAALYGVTPEQQEELRYAIQYTWGQIAWDVHLGNHATEDQQMIELVCDANQGYNFCTQLNAVFLRTFRQ